MVGSQVRVTLSLIAPTLVLIFGITFVGIWCVYRRRTYLLHLATGCALFAAGAVSQILYMPRDSGANALVSGLLYTAAVCAATQGILNRVGRGLPWRAYAVFCAAIMVALWYFFYVDRNLLVRVYVLNIGFGGLLCVAALRMRTAATGRRIDTALFVVLLAFGLHFLPRTLLSIGAHAPSGPLAFADSPFWQWLQLSLAVFSVGLAITLLLAIAADTIEEVRHEGEKDWLTGLLNRRGFEARMRPYQNGGPDPAALIVCDVDHFKRINDGYGHDGGDAVLKNVARVLALSVRKRDLLGRIGGEEFAVYLPATDFQEALHCAERLRAAVADTVRAPDLATPVTMSLGVAAAIGAENWESLFRRADENLYAAKRAGRNQVAA